MTSEEIEKMQPHGWSPAQSEAFWLKEIAYQLAVMNERPRCSHCIDIQSQMMQAMLTAETQKGQNR